MSDTVVPFATLWAQYKDRVDRLVHSLIKGKSISDSNYRLLLAAGQVALWEASTRHDTQKLQGGTFWTFARHRIVGAVYDEMRSWDFLSKYERGRVNKEDLDSSPWALIHPCEVIEAANVVAEDNPEENVARAEQARLLAQRIDKLPFQEKLVARKLLIDHMTITEISQDLQVTQGRICQIRNQFESKLVNTKR